MTLFKPIQKHTILLHITNNNNNNNLRLKYRNKKKKTADVWGQASTMSEVPKKLNPTLKKSECSSRHIQKKYRFGASFIYILRGTNANKGTHCKQHKHKPKRNKSTHCIKVSNSLHTRANTTTLFQHERM